MTKLVILFACIVVIGVPLVLAYRIWRLNSPTRMSWLISVAGNVTVVLFILLIGRWDIAGMWTRTALIAILFVTLVVSWRKHSDRAGWPVQQDSSKRLVGSVTLVLSFVLLTYAAAGMRPHGVPLDMAFPLRGGSFVVAQGGGNILLNHHSDHPGQQYATDFTAVDRLGFRAPGILPTDPSRYAVFGAEVVSPCDGEVLNIVDELPDLPPPRSDPGNPAGNSIQIACKETEVELAHLSRDSIAVLPGDRVKKGQRVARVGNSGNTTEPHLHIHAIDPATKQGVPLAFDGRLPIRNRRYVR